MAISTTMNVPLVDLGAQYATIAHEIDGALRRVLDKGDFVLGAAVRDFEAAFASYCDVPHAIGVGSGTDALFLAMKALDLGPGDELLTTDHAYQACRNTLDFVLGPVGPRIIVLGSNWTNAVEISVLVDSLLSAGKTVVLITHEEEVARFAKRVVRLRDGHIQSDTRTVQSDSRQEAS